MTRLATIALAFAFSAAPLVPARADNSARIRELESRLGAAEERVRKLENRVRRLEDKPDAQGETVARETVDCLARGKLPTIDSLGLRRCQ